MSEFWTIFKKFWTDSRHNFRQDMSISGRYETEFLTSFGWDIYQLTNIFIEPRGEHFENFSKPDYDFGDFFEILKLFWRFQRISSKFYT